MTDLFANLKAKGITFETHVKVIWQNPKGKLSRSIKPGGLIPRFSGGRTLAVNPWVQTIKRPHESASPFPTIPTRIMDQPMSALSRISPIAAR
jgi:hypothetical protein